jgi:F-type H+-transporting ATPase subunit alpha
MPETHETVHPYIQKEMKRIRHELGWLGSNTELDHAQVENVFNEKQPHSQPIRENLNLKTHIHLQRSQMATLLRLVRQVSSRYQCQAQKLDVGTVQHIGNGIAILSGLRQVGIDELVTFPTGVQGMVMNLDRDRVHAILLGSDIGVHGGDLVVATGKRLRTPVGMKLLGRVINPLGKPLDGLGALESSDHYLLERPAPAIVERKPVCEPLFTGLKTIDALFPIGRGQRELIIGDRQTGKTALAIDTILSQKGKNVFCVYVAIGQKSSSTLSTLQTLRAANALEYTTVVVANPDDPPALRYLAPYAGCSIAEYLTHQFGYDTLVVYDDLNHHADAYRELSLLLRRPPGREAYPGDIFYLHARLLERACRLSPEAGDGSLTALPIVEIQRGNLSAYIPTNLISITDGQLVLGSELFNKGIKPAINIGRSVSRVGGAAQTSAMRQLSGTIRLELAQYEEVARFARFGTDLDKTTQQQIQRGQRLEALLTQPVHQPINLSHQVVLFYAVAAHRLDKIAVKNIRTFEKQLLKFCETHYSKMLGDIEKEGEITLQIQAALDKALDEFEKEYEKQEK